jgi:hypothetical protein
MTVSPIRISPLVSEGDCSAHAVSALLNCLMLAGWPVLATPAEHSAHEDEPLPQTCPRETGRRGGSADVRRLDLKHR